jgi:DNA polymerase III epsilon subunit-like protein
MIDMETLGTGADAVVLSLGAVKFDEKFMDRDTFHHMFDAQEQIDRGRTVTASTITWWMQQDDGARAQFNSSRIQLGAGLILDAFDRFFAGSKYLWSHGATFDAVILADLYRHRKHTPPWQFYNVRDTRTLFSLIHDMRPTASDQLMDILKPQGITAHHAVADAWNQAEAVRFAWKELAP